MARCPHATWDPLGPQAEPKMMAHNILCFHTMAGDFAVVDKMFHDRGYYGTESHLGVRLDGFAKQWQDIMFQADANLDGAADVVSIECEDDAKDIPFSDDQLDKLIAIGTWFCSKEAHKDCPADWACHQYGIPPIFVPDSKPGRRGIATHRQGVDGNFTRPWPYAGRVTGGVKWSGVFGKLCPRDTRIRQVHEVIVPAIKHNLQAQPDYDFVVVATRGTNERKRRFTRLGKGWERFIRRRVKRGWKATTKRVRVR